MKLRRLWRNFKRRQQSKKEESPLFPASPASAKRLELDIEPRRHGVLVLWWCDSRVGDINRESLLEYSCTSAAARLGGNSERVIGKVIAVIPSGRNT